MEKIEKIIYNGKILAIVIRKGTSKKGVNFITPQDFSQQLGLLVHEKGKRIEAHKHKQIKREITLTQEVLVVLEGKIKVDLYGEQPEKIKSVLITGGETILLAQGAHAIEILEDSTIIEVKQGPYAGMDDKEYI